MGWFGGAGPFGRSSAAVDRAVHGGDKSRQYFHDNRPWSVWLVQESLLLLATTIATFLGFATIIILPLAAMYPLLTAMQPSSVMLVILMPCVILYALMFSAIAFRTSNWSAG